MIKIKGKFCLLLLAIFLAAGLLCSVFFIGKAQTFGAEQQCQVLATSCPLYSEPSFNDGENDYYVKDESGHAITFANNDILTLLSGGIESQDFIYVQGEKNGKIYAGYVYKYLVTFNLEKQQIYPEFNATVVSDNAKVYDLDGQPTDIVLKKDTRLYLYKGYDKRQDKIAVCFVNDDGQLYYGFLDRKNLSPDGINSTIITGIVVAFSCITIIFLLLFMKRKSKKKKKAE